MHLCINPAQERSVGVSQPPILRPVSRTLHKLTVHISISVQNTMNAILVDEE